MGRIVHEIEVFRAAGYGSLSLYVFVYFKTLLYTVTWFSKKRRWEKDSYRS